MAGGVYGTVMGESELMAKLRAMPDHISKPIAQEITLSAMMVHGDAVRSLQEGPATGRIYEKYSPRRTHKASAPGEAPMSDTGDLARLTTWRVTADGLTAYVEAIPDYGAYLEHGTVDMEPRPWLYPAYEKRKPGILSRIGKAIREALAKLAKQDKDMSGGNS